MDQDTTTMPQDDATTPMTDNSAMGGATSTDEHKGQHWDETTQTWVDDVPAEGAMNDGMGTDAAGEDTTAEDDQMPM